MRDIGNLEKRIENLELTTTLSALEVNAQSFEVRDADPRRIKNLRIRQKKVQVKSEDDAPLAQKLD